MLATASVTSRMGCTRTSPLGRSAILRATKDQQSRIEPSFPSNIRSRPSPLSNTLNRKPLTFEHFRRLKRRGQHVEFRGHDD
jgi:hypothetical protein